MTTSQRASMTKNAGGILLLGFAIATITLSLSYGVIETHAAGTNDKKPPKEAVNGKDCITEKDEKEFEKYLSENRLNIKACTLANLTQFPTVQKTLVGTKVYNNDAGSVKDCKAYVKETKQELRISAFQDATLEAVEKIDKTGDANAVACLAESLYIWADQGGMTKVTGEEKLDLARVVNLLPALMAYIKLPAVRDYAERQSVSGKTKDKVIRSWLAKLGTEFKDRMQKPLDRGDLGTHADAHGLAVTAIGVINKDEKMMKFGADILKTSLASINKNGLMAAEKKRAEQALVYHLTSLYEMVGTYALGSLASCQFNLSSTETNKFIDLYVTLIKAQDDPKWFAKAIGVKEVSSNTGTPVTNYFVLLKTTQPGFYNKLAAAIESRTTVDPDTYTTPAMSAKASKERLGGRLLPLANELQVLKGENNGFCN